MTAAYDAAISSLADALFVGLTVVAGLLAYRTVRDREGAPDPVDALAGRKK